MSAYQSSREQRRGVVAVMAVTRVPLFLLVAATVFYLAAAATAWQVRNYGLDDADLVSVDIALNQTDGETPNLVTALDAIRNDLQRGPCRALLIVRDDAGVSLGVYDPDRVWFGLPFTADDYQGSRRLISLRHGSVASSLRSDALVLFDAVEVLPDYSDQGSPPRADLTYPLFAAGHLEGELLISGRPEGDLKPLTDALRASGYEVAATGSPRFIGEIMRAPAVVVIWITLLLTWVSVAVSWGVQAASLRSRLQKETLIGGTPGRIAANQLYRPLTAWLLACALTTAPAAIYLASQSRIVMPPYLWLVWLLMLLVDAGFAILLFWLRCRRLAGLEHA